MQPAGGGQSSRGESVQPVGGVSPAREGVSPAGGGGWFSPAAGGEGGSAKIGQQNEYSLHGGRYASCVHVGELSCFEKSRIIFIHDKPAQIILQHRICVLLLYKNISYH